MWGIIASVAGPIIGGLINSDSADQASQAQTQASDAAVGETRRQYDQSRTDLAPYREAGTAGVQKLGQLLGTSPGAFNAQTYLAENPDVADAVARGEMTAQQHWDQYGKNEGRKGAYSSDFGSLNKRFTLEDFWSDPVTKASYQSGLDLGAKAISNMAGARGMKNSGQTLKALTRFGTDYTGSQAGASQNRFVADQTNQYNRLAGVAGTGQTAANTTATLGANTANTVGGLISAGGNARGAAAIAGGNAISGGINNATNYYGQQQMLNQLIGRNNPASYSAPDYGAYF